MKRLFAYVRYLILSLIEIHKGALISDFLNFLAISSLTVISVVVLFFMTNFKEILTSYWGNMSILVYVNKYPDENTLGDLKKIDGIKSIEVEEGREIVRKYFSSDRTDLIETLMNIKFPYSIKINLRKDVIPARAIGRIKKEVVKLLQPVYVDTGEEMFISINKIIYIGRLFSIAIFTLFLVGIIVVVTGGVRSGILTHKREIEILKLVGGARWFVGSPFIIKYTYMTIFYCIAGILFFHIIGEKYFFNQNNVWQYLVLNPVRREYYFYIIGTGAISSLISSYYTVRRLL